MNDEPQDSPLASGEHELELGTVWRDEPGSFPPMHKNAKEQLIQFLSQHRDELAAHLLRGNIHWKVGAEEINALVDDIVAQEGLEKPTIRNQIIALGYVIAKGNEQKSWQIPIPPIPVYVRRERNPFQPLNFPQLPAGRDLAKVVMDSILDDTPLSEEAEIGRILLAAITRGGLLNINSVDTLLGVIEKPLMVINDRSFIDLSLRWQGHDDVEGRRWFPDPLTEVLILKTNVGQKSLGEKAWPYIRKFFREAKVPVARRPKNMTVLIEAISLDLRLSIPPFLVSYAMRSFVSHSLKRHGWLRLQGVEEYDELIEEAVDDGHLQEPDADEIGIREYGDTTWNCVIRGALNQSTKDLSKSALKEAMEASAISDGPPVARYIAEWAIHMLKNGSKAGKSLKLPTIKSYVSKISLQLYGLVNEEDLAHFNAEAFEEIYEQILEEASSAGMRKRLARILGEFHTFLMTTHDAPTLDGSVLGAGRALAPVDANLLYIEEFNQTLINLDESDLILIHPDMVEIAQLISILAFRCGLRRSEVLKLRIIDVQGKVDPEILVRPHATRRLKTKNSTRRVLLSCLLEEHELKMLLDWADKRREQESSSSYSPYLFSIPERHYAYVPEDLVFPAIHRAMRKAAGDSSLRFHHFRHSCASWNALRLMIADVGMPEGFFECMPETYKWLNKSGEFKQAIYRHDNPTRKHIYAIASILGHSSPDITLEHYIHWCDVLTHHVIGKSIRPVENKVWVKATGLPQANIYRWLAEGGEKNLLKKLRKKMPERIEVIRGKRLEVPVDEGADEIKDVSIGTRIDTVWKLLYLHSARQIPVEDLAERYGFTLEEAIVFVKEAKRISSLRSRDRHKSFRHRMMETESDERLICPRRPRDADSIKLAEDFLKRLDQLMLEQPDECRWILKYYIEHAWSELNDLIFRSSKQAKRFLDSLKIMGIPTKAIRLTWYHGHGLATHSDRDRKKYWRDKLELPRAWRMASKQLNDTRLLGEHGWLGVRLLDCHNEDSLGQSSYAYRYSLVMFSIIGCQ